MIAFGNAGCTDDGSPSRPGSSTPSASSAARSLGPVTLPRQPGPMVDTITRQVRAAGTVHADVVVAAADGGAQISQLSADVRTDAEPPAARLTVVDQSTPTPTTTHALVTGGSVYTRVDGQEQEPGKPWARLSRDDLKGRDLGAAGRLIKLILDQTDAALREVTTDTGLALVRNGAFRGGPATETLAGRPVQRYQGATPTAAMAATDPSYKAMATAGLKELPWTLWVDDRGLPARFLVTLTTRTGQRAQHTATYTSWGKPITIQLPPAGQVSTIG